MLYDVGAAAVAAAAAAAATNAGAGAPAAGGATSSASSEAAAGAVALRNLRHFVLAAVGDPAPPPGEVEYVFLLPEGSGGAADGAAADGAAAAALAAGLPELPPGAAARYATADAGCARGAGWAAFGAHLAAAELARFDAVVLVPSTHAGPFLPKYARGRVHWLTPLLSKLGGGDSGEVGLVAPTLSCVQTRGRQPCSSASGGNISDADAGGCAPRQIVHPELGPVALSRAALRLLLAADPQRAGVFGCHARAALAEHYTAAAAAALLLRGGFALDSLMLVRFLGGACAEVWVCVLPPNGYLCPPDTSRVSTQQNVSSRLPPPSHPPHSLPSQRYQGIDWRDARHWRCNAG